MADNHSLQRLLSAFNVTDLGEGDPITGCNLLATMAVTLGNLSQPGSGLRSTDGRLLPVSCNLLATGSLLGSLVIDEVVTPVGRCQDNLLGQLTRLLKNDAAEGNKPTPRKWSLAKGQPNQGEKALLQIMTRDQDFPPLFGSIQDEWKQVLSEPPSPRVEDLVRRPRVFVTAHTRSHLEKLLPDAHLGEALVAIGLGRAADATKLDDLFPRLMDGMFPGGPAGELVRGRLLVTDRGGILREVAASTDAKHSWLGRLVWLVEGDAGPDAPPVGKTGGLIQLPRLTRRFGEAVRSTIARRLDTDEPQPLVYTEDLSSYQANWMEFLRDKEASLPGIRGIARSLFPSLVFGLARLTAAGVPQGFQYHLEGIEAFARFLIERMEAARNEMLWSPEQARRLRLKESLLEKLADGPQEARSMARRFHRLPKPVCKGLLQELEDEGKAMLIGSKWTLTKRQPTTR
ncbi:hypothetical protein HZ994_02345 [Akkermansiaceae bacterium]|nr:hypothetical protein HZ994_02345 [Akkermansiaceae bacterium]